MNCLDSVTKMSPKYGKILGVFGGCRQGWIAVLLPASYIPGESAHGAPGPKTKPWLDKFSDVDRKCARDQEMAVEVLIHFEEEELRARIAELEDAPSTAERGLSPLRNCTSRYNRSTRAGKPC